MRNEIPSANASDYSFLHPSSPQCSSHFTLLGHNYPLLPSLNNGLHLCPPPSWLVVSSRSPHNICPPNDTFSSPLLGLHATDARLSRVHNSPSSPLCIHHPPLPPLYTIILLVLYTAQLLPNTWSEQRCERGRLEDGFQSICQEVSSRSRW